MIPAFALLLPEYPAGFEILALEAAQVFLGQHLIDGLLVRLGEVGVLVELGLEALHLFEVGAECHLGSIALEVGDGGGGAVEPLGLHEGFQLLHGTPQLPDDDRGLVHKPDFPCLLSGLFAGEEGDGGIDRVLLLAEVEDVAVGFGAIEHAVGAGKSLNETVMLEVLVHVERVQELRVKAGEQHVHHDGDVDLLRGGEIRIGPLLILDALLHVLVVEVELADAVIRAIAGIVVCHY